MGKFSSSLEKAGVSLQCDQELKSPGLADGDKVNIDQERRVQTAAMKDHSAFQDGSGKWDDRLVQSDNFSGEVAESFRLLRSKILMPYEGRSTPRTIMVTSVLPREGKSFVSANLGISLAQGVDHYSLLVDCDLRLPTLAGLFGMVGNRGLADYLKYKTEISTLIRRTSMDKLSILASGVPPVNPAELLGSERMHELVCELSARYPDRFVIFDSPPLKVASESMVLAREVDGVVLVVRQGVSSRALIEQAIEDIGKQKIIGVVFNGYKSNIVTSRLINQSAAYFGDYYHQKER